MSADSYQKFITSSSQPVAGQTGDEWFNPATNKLYQFINVSGQGLQWVEQLTAVSSGATISVGNVTVTGGTGSFNGSTTTLAMTTVNMGETVGLSATVLPGYFTYELTKQTILYVTVNASSNLIINFVGSLATPLNTVMTVGQSISAVLMVTNGSPAYYPTTIQIDGITITPKWQGGTAPSSGNTNATDVYSYTIIKTANATYTVLASQSKFV